MNTYTFNFKKYIQPSL